MTVGALTDFGIMFAFLEMADKTGAVRDCNVLSLNDLGMAASAPKLLAPLQVSEMYFVVKNDLVEVDLSFKESFVMTTFAETAFVRNLGPGLGFQVEF